MTGRGLRRGGLTAAPGIVVAPLVIGCSVSVGTGGLNETKLQDEIHNKIQQVTGVAPATVNCPTDAKQGKGNDFQCAAIVEGQTVTVNVTQTDDSGHVTFATADAMLHRTDVEQFIHADAQRKGAGQVTVNCGTTTIVVAKVGSTFNCTLDTSAGQQTAVVTAENADGHFSVQYQEPSGAPTQTPTEEPTDVPTDSSTGSAF